jgi:hypothetical protein
MLGLYRIFILLRGIQLTYDQLYRGSTVKMVLKKFFLLLEMRLIHMWRSRTPAGVRCAHFPSFITTIMDHKVQLLKPLNKSELYAT